jgi:hypothetical protein
VAIDQLLFAPVFIASIMAVMCAVEVSRVGSVVYRNGGVPKSPPCRALVGLALHDSSIHLVGAVGGGAVHVTIPCSCGYCSWLRFPNIESPFLSAWRLAKHVSASVAVGMCWLPAVISVLLCRHSSIPLDRH